jgi:hypothetical protein
MQQLIQLLPGQHGQHHEWMLAESITDAQEVAHHVADDVERYGFPYIERISSPEELLREMNLPVHRLIRRLDRAVLSMFCGRVSDARRTLMENLPISNCPMTWGDPSYAGFLHAFSIHFNIDLDVESWPLRERIAKNEIRVNVRDRESIRLALEYVGRSDLAGRVEKLTGKQLEDIGIRATRIMRHAKGKDYQRAVGLAAVESME